ncbi:hypothetical protein SAMN05216312_108117 [Cohnella sp. OV330]|uniref:hypothetical protein n=1 Tax=Cohnella sp. OV330 TaxID=1855288 RepID=UPI0008EA4C88|nr:hypothetical protein [Cohnella sp. OV330]SFB44164.1 hypothetical protein SAMN05216312_108117 [Cohnella sp. OV330]
MNGTIEWPSGARQIVEEGAGEAGAAAGFSLSATIVFGIGLIVTVLIVISIYRRRRK